MTDLTAALGSWPHVANIWFLTAAGAAALFAYLQGSRLVRRFRPARSASSAPGGFERFWSRRDGRGLAVAWIVLLALTIGEGGLVWSDDWRPVEVFFTTLQPLAGLFLVPITAALNLFGRSIPRVAHSDCDERERAIQGSVYRLAYALLLGSLGIAIGLLVLNPSIGSMIAQTMSSRSAEPIDIAIPAFLVLYMLPSVVFAWRLPHPDGAAAGEAPVVLAAGGDAA